MHLFGSVDFVISGQSILGGSVSFTVTLKEQLGPALLVQLTGVVPLPKNEPEGGAQVTVPVPHALEFGAKVTMAPHWLTSFS